MASDINPELLQDMPPNTPAPVTLPISVVGTNDNGTNGNSHPEDKVVANDEEEEDVAEESNKDTTTTPEEAANNEQTEIKDVEEAVKPQKPANGKVLHGLLN